MGGSDANRVRSIPLFQNLGDRCQSILLKSASLRYFPARTLLFNERARANVLYTLLQGSVELFSEHHDQRSTIAVIRSIRPIMLTSILDNINPLSACTLERSELSLVPLRIVHELIDFDVSFAGAIAYELARDLRKTTEDFKNDRLQTGVERLAGWILRSDKESGGTGHFVIPYGKHVLASQLGMTAESLSRNFASLAARGVTVRGRQISVSDRTALAELASVGDAVAIHEDAPLLAQVSWHTAGRKRADPHLEIERASKKGHPALASD